LKVQFHGLFGFGNCPEPLGRLLASMAFPQSEQVEYSGITGNIPIEPNENGLEVSANIVRSSLWIDQGRHILENA
jgi:hypothetical protein